MKNNTINMEQTNIDLQSFSSEDLAKEILRRKETENITEKCVNEINRNLKILKGFGVVIKDSDDHDIVLQSIYLEDNDKVWFETYCN